MTNNKKDGVSALFRDCEVGDIPGGDPFNFDTPYGRPSVIARGDVFAERDTLEKAIWFAIDYHGSSYTDGLEWLDGWMRRDADAVAEFENYAQ